MKQLLLGILCISLYSCSPSNKEQSQHEDTYSIIDLTDLKYSDEPSKLSDFVDSISYLRLDDTPLIPALTFTGIAISDDAIYVDEQFIYKYTLNGKFIKSLFKKGQGPDEALKVTTKAAYDFKRNIVAIDNALGTTYRIYTLEGEHIGDVPKYETPKWGRKIIGYVGENEVYNYIISQRPLRGDTINCDGPYFLYVKDLKADTTIYQQKNYHYNIKAVVQNGMLTDEGYPLCYGMNGNAFWWKHQSVDTIYCTTDFKDVRPWYVLKKNKSLADYEFCVHRMVCDVPTYDLSHKFVSTMYPLENGVLYNIAGDFSDSGFGFCKKNGKAFTYSPKGFINDVDEYFKSWKPYDVLGGRGWLKDGYLYSLMNAFDFFEEGAKPPFSDLTEDSNPVIVKFKLKKYEE